MSEKFKRLEKAGKAMHAAAGIERGGQDDAEATENAEATAPQPETVQRSLAQLNTQLDRLLQKIKQRREQHGFSHDQLRTHKSADRDENYAKLYERIGRLRRRVNQATSAEELDAAEVSHIRSEAAELLEVFRTSYRQTPEHAAAADAEETSVDTDNVETDAAEPLVLDTDMRIDDESQEVPAVTTERYADITEPVGEREIESGTRGIALVNGEKRPARFVERTQSGRIEVSLEDEDEARNDVVVAADQFQVFASQERLALKQEWKDLRDARYTAEQQHAWWKVGSWGSRSRAAKAEQAAHQKYVQALLPELQKREARNQQDGQVVENLQRRLPELQSRLTELQRESDADTDHREVAMLERRINNVERFNANPEQFYRLWAINQFILRKKQEDNAMRKEWLSEEQKQNLVSIKEHLSRHKWRYRSIGLGAAVLVTGGTAALAGGTLSSVMLAGAGGGAGWGTRFLAGTAAGGLVGGAVNAGESLKVRRQERATAQVEAQTTASSFDRLINDFATVNAEYVAAFDDLETAHKARTRNTFIAAGTAGFVAGGATAVSLAGLENAIDNLTNELTANNPTEAQDLLGVSNMSETEFTADDAPELPTSDRFVAGASPEPVMAPDLDTPVAVDTSPTHEAASLDTTHVPETETKVPAAVDAVTASPEQPATPTTEATAGDIGTLDPDGFQDARPDTTIPRPTPVAPVSEDLPTVDSEDVQPVTANSPEQPTAPTTEANTGDIGTLDPDGFQDARPQTEVPEATAVSESAETSPGLSDLVPNPEQAIAVPKGSTVSEELYRAYRAGELTGLPEEMGKSEFLSKMWAALHAVDNNDAIMERMHLSSGDVDEIKAGDSFNAAPIIEHMNGRSIAEIERGQYATIDALAREGETPRATTDAESVRPEARPADAETATAETTTAEVADTNPVTPEMLATAPEAVEAYQTKYFSDWGMNEAIQQHHLAEASAWAQAEGVTDAATLADRLDYQMQRDVLFTELIGQRVAVSDASLGAESASAAIEQWYQQEVPHDYYARELSTLPDREVDALQGLAGANKLNPRDSIEAALQTILANNEVRLVDNDIKIFKKS